MFARHLIVAPHPDDELIGCGAIIARAVRAGEAVRVVMVTSGQNLLSVLARITTEPSPDEVGRRREAESVRACRLLGLATEHILFLRYTDGFVARDAVAVTADCRSLITEFQPTRLYCTSPWDVHADHRAAAHAVAAARVAAGSTAELWQYAARDVLDASGAPYVALNVGEFDELKRAALAECRSHIDVISPHQQRPIQADFVNDFCHAEECFALR